jgi:hypothetical protein
MPTSQGRFEGDQKKIKEGAEEERRGRRKGGMECRMAEGLADSYLMVATTMVVLLMRFLDEEGGLTTEGKVEAKMPYRSACRGGGKQMRGRGFDVAN